MTDKHVVIYTDGGCRGNGTLKPQAYGSYKIGDAEPMRMKFGKQTSNQAEYMALIEALKQMPDNSMPILRTDSQLMVNQVLQLWKVKALGLKRHFTKAVFHFNRTKAQIEHVPREQIVEVLGH